MVYYYYLSNNSNSRSFILEKNAFWKLWLKPLVSQE